ncbi:HAMP domain-containing sensor histidine kinase [Actinospica sp.]|uniref:sensor histidine kinase n=1 Tax=Actinospica sp. TaxID=1872142 RepID=UPI002BEDF305|nr:HAMP domain-containing sensor histidine kinase [Actinospica sp.]HWG28490.1 HAMP domain-containing sensor histidine kinase [Actinospica sp.]
MIFGRRPTTPERRLLRRTAAILACRIAAGFALALAVLGFCTYRMVMAEQHQQAEKGLDFVLAYASPDAAEPCLWLFELDDGKLLRPAQVPAGFPLESAIASAPSNGGAVRTSVTRNGTVYDVVTVRHAAIVRQAVFDTTYEQADLDHLLRALILVGIIGIVLATLVGAEIGRRSIMPLGDAMARQRRFVADASHELRTPLTRLHTRAQLLLRWRQGQLPEELADELTALVRSSRDLNDVVEDLLLSAGLRSDPSRRELVDLTELTAAAVDAERPRLASRSLTLISSPATVCGAASPLRRMIATLLDNAISHTDSTGRIQVTLRPADRGGSIELEVADNGTGFDPADSERIFERFAQSGHSGPRRFGLGLALAREIATDHGGTIRAVGCLGSGATITVRLPRAPDGAIRSGKPAPHGTAVEAGRQERPVG